MVAAVTLRLVKSALYQTRWGIIAAHLVHNTLRRTGLVTGQIDNPYVTPRTEADIPVALAHIRSVYNRYIQYGKLTPETLAGSHVLEIGPGNTIGIPLMFAAAGAARAAALDKFVPFQDTPYHRRLYSELRSGLDDQGRRRFDEALQITDRLVPNPARLEYVRGKGMEDAPFPPRSFDVIVSAAVIMEAYDADALFRSLDQALKPGGRMVHIIDLRDFSMFQKRGFHPLEFLTIPDGLYRHMADRIGQPNRRMVDFYRAQMASLGYEAEIYVTWIAGAPKGLDTFKLSLEPGVDYGEEALQMIREIRPRLLPRYQQLSDQDLLTSGILLVARKPAEGTARPARSAGALPSP